VPVVGDVPAGGKFVIEIVAPDMLNTGFMYIGATNSGQTHQGYISSASCAGAGTPETTVAAGGTGQLIINVTGTH
jgi:hypothetical protein